MSRLAGAVDGVISVDPTATPSPRPPPMWWGLLAQTSVRVDAAGYRRLFDFARAQVPGRRCWAVGGCRQLWRRAGPLPAGA